VVWHDERQSHWTFFQEAIVESHLYLGMLEHYRVPQLPCDAWFQQDRAHPTFWKQCPSVSGQLNWKRRFPSIINITSGIFPFGLSEEYCLCGENGRHSNPATSDNRGDHSSDRSHAARDLTSFRATDAAHSGIHCVTQKNFEFCATEL
jgi:hypothetical protein